MIKQIYVQNQGLNNGFAQTQTFSESVTTDKTRAGQSQTRNADSTQSFVDQFQADKFAGLLTTNLGGNISNAELVRIIQRPGGFILIFKSAETDTGVPFYFGFRTASLAEPVDVQNFSRSSNLARISQFFAGLYPASGQSASATNVDTQTSVATNQNNQIRTSATSAASDFTSTKVPKADEITQRIRAQQLVSNQALANQNQGTTQMEASQKSFSATSDQFSSNGASSNSLSQIQGSESSSEATDSTQPFTVIRKRTQSVAAPSSVDFPSLSEGIKNSFQTQTIQTSDKLIFGANPSVIGANFLNYPADVRESILKQVTIEFLPQFFQGLKPEFQIDFISAQTDAVQSKIYPFLNNQQKLAYLKLKSPEQASKILQDLSFQQQLDNFAFLGPTYQKAFLNRLSPKDLYYFVHSLPTDRATSTLQLISQDQLTSIFPTLSEAEQTEFINSLTVNRNINAITNLPSNSLNSLIYSLSPKNQAKIIFILTAPQRQNYYSFKDFQDTQTSSTGRTSTNQIRSGSFSQTLSAQNAGVNQFGGLDQNFSATKQVSASEGRVNPQVIKFLLNNIYNGDQKALLNDLSGNTKGIPRLLQTSSNDLVAQARQFLQAQGISGGNTQLGGNESTGQFNSLSLSDVISNIAQGSTSSKNTQTTSSNQISGTSSQAGSAVKSSSSSNMNQNSGRNVLLKDVLASQSIRATDSFSGQNIQGNMITDDKSNSLRGMIQYLLTQNQGNQASSQGVSSQRSIGVEEYKGGIKAGDASSASYSQINSNMPQMQQGIRTVTETTKTQVSSSGNNGDNNQFRRKLLDFINFGLSPSNQIQDSQVSTQQSASSTRVADIKTNVGATDASTTTTIASTNSVTGNQSLEAQLIGLLRTAQQNGTLNAVINELPGQLRNSLVSILNSIQGQGQKIGGSSVNIGYQAKDSSINLSRGSDSGAVGSTTSYFSQNSGFQTLPVQNLPSVQTSNVNLLRGSSNAFSSGMKGSTQSYSQSNDATSTQNNGMQNGLARNNAGYSSSKYISAGKGSNISGASDGFMTAGSNQSIYDSSSNSSLNLESMSTNQLIELLSQNNLLTPSVKNRVYAKLSQIQPTSSSFTNSISGTQMGTQILNAQNFSR